MFFLCISSSASKSSAEKIVSSFLSELIGCVIDLFTCVEPCNFETDSRSINELQELAIRGVCEHKVKTLLILEGAGQRDDPGCAVEKVQGLFFSLHIILLIFSDYCCLLADFHCNGK